MLRTIVLLNVPVTKSLKKTTHNFIVTPHRVIPLLCEERMYLKLFSSFTSNLLGISTTFTLFPSVLFTVTSALTLRRLRLIVGFD